MRKAVNRQIRELATLKRLKDTEIDLSEIPELRDWTSAVVGRFYRPIKRSLTIRLDADVLAWLKAQGKGYQTRINGLLREAMEVQGRQHGATLGVKSRRSPPNTGVALRYQNHRT